MLNEDKYYVELNENIMLNLDETIKDFLYNELEESEVEDTIQKIKEIVVLLINKEKIVADKIYLDIYSATMEDIKDLNNEYRAVNKPTDVLSFPMFSKEELLSINSNLKNTKLEANKYNLNEIILGDIVICLEIVKMQAIEYNTGLKRELLYMITHGICHLLGYDHETEEEKTEMRSVEEEILNKIGVVR